MSVPATGAPSSQMWQVALFPLVSAHSALSTGSGIEGLLKNSRAAGFGSQQATRKMHTCSTAEANRFSVRIFII